MSNTNYQELSPLIDNNGNAGIGNMTSVVNSGSVFSFSGSTLNYDPIDSRLKNSLKVAGNAEIDGQLKVGGKNLCELLDQIERRLAILTPNPELEAKWEELKELGERYRELEKDILEKEAIYKTLSR
jgi:hypothetical protein